MTMSTNQTDKVPFGVSDIIPLLFLLASICAGIWLVFNGEIIITHAVYAVRPGMVIAAILLVSSILSPFSALMSIIRDYVLIIISLCLVFVIVAFLTFFVTNAAIFLWNMEDTIQSNHNWRSINRPS